MPKSVDYNNFNLPDYLLRLPYSTSLFCQFYSKLQIKKADPKVLSLESARKIPFLFIKRRY